MCFTAQGSDGGGADISQALDPLRPEPRTHLLTAMLDLISKGGPLVWLLLGCFGLSLAIFLERLSDYHRAGLNIGEFLAGLASLIRRKNYAEALQECVATRVPAGRVMHAALLRHHSPRE